MIENKEEVYKVIEKIMKVLSKKYSYRNQDIAFHIILNKVYTQLIPFLNCHFSELTQDDKTFIRSSVQILLDGWN